MKYDERILKYIETKNSIPTITGDEFNGSTRHKKRKAKKAKKCWVRQINRENLAIMERAGS